MFQYHLERQNCGVSLRKWPCVAISKPCGGILDNLKSTPDKLYIKLLLPFESALYNSILRPSDQLQVWTLSRSHLHSDPIINTHTIQVRRLWMGLSWHTLSPWYRPNLTVTLKIKDLATCGYPKIPHAHKNWLKPSPVLERSTYPLQNYKDDFPCSPLGYKSTPSQMSWTEAYCPKF